MTCMRLEQRQFCIYHESYHSTSGIYLQSLAQRLLMEMAPHIRRSSALFFQSNGCSCSDTFQQASEFGFALIGNVMCCKHASGFTELYVERLQIYMGFFAHALRCLYIIHWVRHARTHTTRNVNKSIHIYIDFRYAGVRAVVSKSYLVSS